MIGAAPSCSVSWGAGGLGAACKHTPVPAFGASDYVFAAARAGTVVVVVAGLLLSSLLLLLLPAGFAAP